VLDLWPRTLHVASRIRNGSSGGETCMASRRVSVPFPSSFQGFCGVLVDARVSVVW